MEEALDLSSDKILNELMNRRWRKTEYCETENLCSETNMGPKRSWGEIERERVLYRGLTLIN